MWHRIGAIVVFAGVAACGGDSSGPSTPTFPAAAGTYQVDGGFDGLTRQQASFTGTLVLTQASREVATLGGTATMTGQISGQVYDLSGGTVQSASITAGGVVTVSVLSPTGSATWAFTGTLSGSSISGRHTLSTSTQAISGDWTGTRVGAAVASSIRGSGGWEALVGALEPGATGRQ